MALLAMLAIGQKGYERIAKAIHETCCHLAEIIKKFDGKLKLVAPPEANVVAFKIDEKAKLEKGAIYAFANEMAQRKFVLNNLNDEMAHFCVTGRFASNKEALKDFEKAAEESWEAVIEHNKKVVNKEGKFPGDAGMYGELGTAMTPTREELSTLEYIKNLLFGVQGAKDAVRAYFLAQLDPYTPPVVS